MDKGRKVGKVRRIEIYFRGVIFNFLFIYIFMEKTNPLYQEDYPEYKKVLWGMLRSFVGSFIPVFGVMLTSVTVETFTDREVLVKFIVSVAIASFVAGLKGIGSYLRDLYPDSPVFAKLPI